MEKKTIVIKGSKDHSIFVRSYRGMSEAKGVIQILHGMAEWGEPYENFASFLVDNGYVVYIHDHRKHGRSISDNQKIGYYIDDTWQDMLDDVEAVQKFIIEEEQINQVILLGYSMGSFLCRNYLMTYGERVSKAIIVGTAYCDLFRTGAGNCLAKVCEIVAGKKTSGLLHYLTLGVNNKGIKQGKQPFEWLNRDEQIVAEYNRSDDCGFPYTPRFYKEMAKGMIYITKKSNIGKTPKIPLLFLSGDDDPIGDYGKGVKKVRAIYDEQGYDTTFELIEGARHDVINDIDKEIVHKKLIVFLEK